MTFPPAPQEGATPTPRATEAMKYCESLPTVDHALGYMYSRAQTLELDLIAANARLLSLAAELQEARRELEESVHIVAPLVIMYEHEGEIIINLHPRDKDTHGGYGILVCDLVRMIAKSFHIEDDAVWNWIEKERYHNTTEITRPS